MNKKLLLGLLAFTPFSMLAMDNAVSKLLRSKFLREGFGKTEFSPEDRRFICSHVEWERGGDNEEIFTTVFQEEDGGIDFRASKIVYRPFSCIVVSQLPVTPKESVVLRIAEKIKRHRDAIGQPVGGMQVSGVQSAREEGKKENE